MRISVSSAECDKVLLQCNISACSAAGAAKRTGERFGRLKNKESSSP
jgi:hypothetical protein